MSSMLPAPLAAFVNSIGPARVLGTALPVIGGVATAEIGGAVAKLVPHVEDFASGGNWQDALVHAGAGTLLNGAITAGYFVATKNGAGAGKIGALLTVGTVVAATRPFVASGIAKAADHATTALAGVFKKAAPALPPSSTQPPAGLSDFTPAGLSDFNPAGDPYGKSAWG